MGRRIVIVDGQMSLDDWLIELGHDRFIGSLRPRVRVSIHDGAMRLLHRLVEDGLREELLVPAAGLVLELELQMMERNGKGEA